MKKIEWIHFSAALTGHTYREQYYFFSICHWLNFPNILLLKSDYFMSCSDFFLWMMILKNGFNLLFTCLSVEFPQSTVNSRDFYYYHSRPLWQAKGRECLEGFRNDFSLFVWRLHFLFPIRRVESYHEWQWLA